eukprot:m.111976 g.111976  ORF g.111976 m.111976 type:complete len:1942 (-) comp10769_c0_seq1:2186-8011(-)
MDVREIFDRYAVPTASGVRVITRGLVTERLQLNGAGQTAQGNELARLADELFRMLDADGDGNVTFEEFSTAFDMQPQAMHKIFADGQGNSAAREVFRQHAGSAKSLSTEYCADLIKRQFADNVGADEDQLAMVSEAFLEMLGVEPGNESAGVSEANFLNAFQTHGAQMNAVFGEMDSRSRRTSLVGLGRASMASIQPSPESGGESGPPAAPRTSLFELATAQGHFDELVPAGMTAKKRDTLRAIFTAADEDGGGTIGPEEMLPVLKDDQLGGVLAKQMRTSFGGSFSDRFVRTMLKQLDHNGDGKFDFNEFCTAFGPVISDNGEYVPEQSVTGAQLYALTEEYHILEAEKRDLQERLGAYEADIDFKSHQFSSVLEERDRLNQQAEDEASRLSRELNKATAELQSRMKAMETLEERLASALDESTEMKQQADRAIAERIKLQSASQAKDVQIAELEGRLCDAEQRIDELEEAAVTAHRKRSVHAEDANASISTLAADLREAEARIEEYMKNEAAADDEIEELRSALSAREHELLLLQAQMNDKLEELTHTKTELAKQIALNERQDFEMHAQLEPIRQSVDRELAVKEREVELLEEKVGQLVMEKEIEVQARTTAEQQLKEARNESTEQEQKMLSQVDVLKSQELSLRAEISQIRKESTNQVSDAENQRQDFLAYVREHEQQSTAWKREVQSLIDELAKAKAALESEKAAFHQSLIDAGAEKGKLEQQIKSQADNIAAMEKDMSDQAAEVAALTARAASAQSSLNARESELSDKLGESERTRAEAESKLAALERELTALSATASEQARQVDDYKKRVDELEKDHADLLSTLHDTQSALEQQLMEEQAHKAKIRNELDKVYESQDDNASSSDQPSARSTFSRRASIRLYGSKPKESNADDQDQDALPALPPSDGQEQVNAVRSLLKDTQQSADTAHHREVDLIDRLGEACRKYDSAMRSKQALQAELEALRKQNADASSAAKERETELILKLAASARSASDAAHRREAELLEQLTESERRGAVFETKLEQAKDDAKKREAELLAQLAAAQMAVEDSASELKKLSNASAKDKSRAHDAINNATKSATFFEEALEKAQHDLASLQHENSRLTELLESANASVSANAGATDVAQKELALARKQLEEARQAAANLQPECTSMAAVLETVHPSHGSRRSTLVHSRGSVGSVAGNEGGDRRTSQYYDSTEDYGDVARASDPQREQYVTVCNDARRMLRTANNVISDQQSHLDAAKSMSQELQQKAEEAQATATTLQSKLDHVNEAHSALEQRNRATLDELAQLRASTQQERTNLEARLRNGQDLDGVLFESKARIAELEAMVTLKDNHIAECDDEIQKLKRNFQKQQEAAAAAANQSLTSAGADADRRLTTLQAEFDAVQARVDIARQRNDSLTQELVNAERAQGELEESLAKANIAADQNARAIMNQEARISAQHRRVAALTAEVDEAVRDRNAERDRSHAAERDLASTQVRVKELEHELARLRQALADAEQEASARRNGPGVGDRLEKLQAAMKNLRHPNGDSATLKSQLDRATAATRQLQDELEAVRNMQHDEELKRRRVEAELQAVNARLKDADAKAQLLQHRADELSSLKMRCAELEATIDELQMDRDELENEMSHRPHVSHRGLDLDDDGEGPEMMAEKDMLIKALRLALQNRNAQVKNLQVSVRDLLQKWPEHAEVPPMPITPPQSPPTVVASRGLDMNDDDDENAVSTPQHHHHRHVLRIEDVRLVPSDLSALLGLADTVDVVLTANTLAVLGAEGVGREWPLAVLKRYGIEDGVCSVEFGGAADLPGVLYLAAGRHRSRLLIRNIRRRLGVTGGRVPRTDIHTFADLVVVPTGLSNTLELPDRVTVQVTNGRFRVKGQDGRSAAWSTNALKRFGIKGGLFCAEIGPLSDGTHGMLRLQADDEARALLKAFQTCAQHPRTN